MGTITSTAELNTAMRADKHVHASPLPITKLDEVLPLFGGQYVVVLLLWHKSGKQSPCSRRKVRRVLGRIYGKRGNGTELEVVGQLRDDAVWALVELHNCTGDIRGKALCTSPYVSEHRARSDFGLFLQEFRPARQMRLAL